MLALDWSGDREGEMLAPPQACGVHHHWERGLAAGSTGTAHCRHTPTGPGLDWAGERLPSSTSAVWTVLGVS